MLNFVVAYDCPYYGEKHLEVKTAEKRELENGEIEILYICPCGRWEEWREQEE